MMNVAVCEEDRLTLREMVEKLSRMEGIDLCEGYDSPLELIQVVQSGRYEMVLMSMDWEPDCENENRGLKAARQIYEMSPEIKIIYMTVNPQQYIQQIFLEPVNLSGFLVKPVMEEVLKKYIDNFAGEQKEEYFSDSFIIRNKGVMQLIHFDEVLYMESSGHMVEVRTRTKSIHCYGSLGKFKELLPDYFVQCHKSYLVNMREIRCLERNCISTIQGERIPVSKSRYGDTRERYFRYIKGMRFAGKGQIKD